MNDSEQPKYTFAGLEKFVNEAVGFFFYYRMAFVLLFLGGIGFAIYEAAIYSNPEFVIKNITFITTCGSVVIGIFYAVLNYEHNHLKSKNDRKFAQSSLAYNTMCDWHKPAMVANLKITKELYDEKKHLIDENKAKDFYDQLEANMEARAALISIFNYLESIAVGITQGVLDEEFIKKTFKSLMISYFNDYFFYISYRRRCHGVPTAWIAFTGLAKKWEDES